MLEPWYPAAWLVVIPPAWLLFTWRLEGIERIPGGGPGADRVQPRLYLDPIANAYAVVKAGRRPRFLAKRELFDVRLVGTVLRGVRQIPVERGPATARRCVSAEEALADGEVVVVYPEGTVTDRPDGLPMQGKTGTVRLALAAGVPIIPMVSWGSAPVWQKSGPGLLKPGRPIWVKRRRADRPLGAGARRPTTTAP